MPIKATRTFTRSSTSAPFYTTTLEWRTYSKTTFTDTGLRISATSDDSNDGLVRTTTTVWKDQAAFDSFMSDSQVRTLFLDPRQLFCEEHNIVISNFTFETV
jgi:hypothetical protein